MRIWLYMNIGDILEPFNMLYHVLNAAEMKSFKFKVSNRPSSWTDSSQVKRQFVSKLTIFEKTLAVSWWWSFEPFTFRFSFSLWKCSENFVSETKIKKHNRMFDPPIKTVRGNGRSSNWTVNLLLLHFVYYDCFCILSNIWLIVAWRPHSIVIFDVYILSTEHFAYYFKVEISFLRAGSLNPVSFR